MRIPDGSFAVAFEQTAALRNRLPQHFDQILRRVLILAALASLASGALLWLFDQSRIASWIWAAGTIPVAAGLLVSMVRDVLAGRMGVDAIAFISMSAALVLGQPLAGIVVAVMYAGGNVLEDFAVGRAERDLKSLVDRAPRVRTVEEARSSRRSLSSEVAIGDMLLVRGGEIVPVDGVIIKSSSHDGQVSADRRADPGRTQGWRGCAQWHVECRGRHSSCGRRQRRRKSTYAGIVRMVTAAQTAKAPFIRLADRYALLLLPVTLHRCRWRLAAVGRSHPRARGVGGSDAMSADSGGASRVHRRRRRRPRGGASSSRAAGRSKRWRAPTRFCSTRQARLTVGGAAAHRSRDRARARSADDVLRLGGLARAGLASCRWLPRSLRRR